MRRAFTLIEIIVIVMIIGLMATVSTVSIARGRAAARVKTATRSVLAMVRYARSTALVSRQPSVITYSTEVTDEVPNIRVEIVTADIFKGTRITRAWTLAGEEVQLGEVVDEMTVTNASGKVATVDVAAEDEEEDEIAEPLIVPGICLKVVMDGEELEETVTEEQKKSTISAWGTASGVIKGYRKNRAAEEKAKEEEERAAAAAGKSAAGVDEATKEPVSILWEVNGRTEPHRLFIYREGTLPQKGWCIRVNKYGEAKMLAPGEEEDE